MAASELYDSSSATDCSLSIGICGKSFSPQVISSCLLTLISGPNSRVGSVRIGASVLQYYQYDVSPTHIVPPVTGVTRFVVENDHDNDTSFGLLQSVI